MTLSVTPSVKIRFGVGAGVGTVLVLGDAIAGQLGNNVLGTVATQVVDITNQVQTISTRRGRDRVFDEYEPGRTTIRFTDRTGDWNPENASGPYYGKILPMNQVQISGTYSGTTYTIFTGYVESYDWEWDYVNGIAFVTIQASDAFRLLNLVDITTVAGAAAGDLPGTRIAQILNQISWPSTLRDLDQGQVTLQTDPGTSRSALNAIQTVEQTEVGGFFIDADGKATFKSRNWFSVAATGTPTVFDDDGTDIPYQALDVSFDETQLSNVVTVTNVGGTAQTASDSTSISQYFTRSFSRSGNLAQTDTAALQQANTILNYRKTAKLRVDSISILLAGLSARITAGLTLDIGSIIRVRRTMPGGSKIDARLTIQGINHEIRPDGWITTFNTAAPLQTAFILGSADFGILGTSTI